LSLCFLASSTAEFNVPAVVGTIGVGSDRQRRGPVRASNAGVQLCPHVIRFVSGDTRGACVEESALRTTASPSIARWALFLSFSYRNSLAVGFWGFGISSTLMKEHSILLFRVRRRRRCDQSISSRNKRCLPIPEILVFLDFSY
jgi:hypothetical protein